MFGFLNYNTMMGESKMSKKPRQFRIDADLLERFDRVNERLYVNGSEVVRRLIKEYVEEKEKELGWGVEKMDKKEHVKQAFLEAHGSDTDWSLAADKFVDWVVQNGFELKSFDNFVEWISDEKINDTWDFFYGYGSDFERFAADWIEDDEERDEYLAFCRE